MLEIVLDSLADTLRLIPFLFVTYLVMEWMEHQTKYDMARLIPEKSLGGPLVGGMLGLLPQCGFSASAASLYAGGMIGMGTLTAVFISTSDEMLPILLSEQADPGLILRLLAFKAVVAVAAGSVVELVYRTLQKGQAGPNIHDMCEKGHCHCENGILRSALHHTVQVGIFVLLISLGLNLLISLIGEETLAGWLLARPVLGPVLSGLVGLIPNCAASVLLTRLYLDGMLSLGSMLAGLIAGSGIGLLVLFKVNRNLKENLTVLGILYGTGVAVGIMIELFGFRLI